MVKKNSRGIIKKGKQKVKKIFIYVNATGFHCGQDLGKPLKHFFIAAHTIVVWTDMFCMFK